MKSLTCLLLFVLISYFNISQAQVARHQLTGIWQINTPSESDAWLNIYRFFKDGMFKYGFNQYDDSGRIMAVKGTYKIVKDSLVLVIKSRTERVGGDIVQGSQGYQQNELVLDGDHIAEIKQTDYTPIVIPIIYSIKKGVRCITLQNNTYYLVSADPHKGE